MESIKNAARKLLNVLFSEESRTCQGCQAQAATPLRKAELIIFSLQNAHEPKERIHNGRLCDSCHEAYSTTGCVLQGDRITAGPETKVNQVLFAKEFATHLESIRKTYEETAREMAGASAETPKPCDKLRTQSEEEG